MKIEKISDTQIKLILTKSEIMEMGIQLEDFTRSTEKTQMFFKDVINQAFSEHGFRIDDSPVMIEARPVAGDGITLTVTKLSGFENIGEGFNMAALSDGAKSQRVNKTPKTNYDYESDGGILIFSFATLDNAIDMSLRLFRHYHGTNSLYKLDGIYYIMLKNDAYSDESDIDDLGLIMSEYGDKCASTTLFMYHIIEHGEPLIKDNAVQSLAKSFS